MLRLIVSSLLLLFAAMLPLGNYDPIFGIQSGITLVQMLMLAFVGLNFFLYPGGSVVSIFSFPVLSILAIVSVLALAQLLYGYSGSGFLVINFKLLFCALFFAGLVCFFKNNPEGVYRVLLVFSLSSSLFCLVVLFFNEGASEVYKGQLIVHGENPNSTASRMSVAFVCLVYFFMSLSGRKKGLKKLSLFLAAFPILLVIIKTGSRGGLLAASLGVFVLVLFSDMPAKKKAIAVLVSAGVGAFAVLYIASLEGVAERWARAMEGDTAGRGEIWSDVIEIFKSNPILGVGETGYLNEIYKLQGYYIDAHNLLLYLAVSGGVVALVLFLFFLMQVMTSAWVSFKNGNVIALVLFIEIMVIALKTGGVMTYLLMWFVFSIIYSCAFLGRKCYEITSDTCVGGIQR